MAGQAGNTGRPAEPSQDSRRAYQALACHAGRRVSFRRHLFVTTSIVALGLALVMTTPSRATDWSGATSTNWTDPTNWSAGLPSNIVDANIDAGTSKPAVVNAPGALAQILTIGASGTGTLTIQSGGTVSDLKGYIGWNANSTGIVTVDGTGSTWTNSNSVNVGVSGNGTLIIQNGGVVTSNAWANVGANAGSTGTVTVTGSGSSWTMSGGANNNLAVGGGYDTATGSLTISNGGLVSNSNGYIGNAVGSTGIVTVTGANSTWTNSGELVVADGWVGPGSGTTTGTLAISNGGTVTNVNGYIGGAPGAIGTATVDGANSTWNNTGDLYVGHFATGTPTQSGGTLTIQNGGTVKNGIGVIGYASGATGKVTVDGPGSSWTNSFALYVGYSGTGTLAISNGGTVSTNQLVFIGHEPGSKGTVTVDGAGSSLTATWQLLVGFSSATGSSTTGALTISNGGKVVSGNGVYDSMIGWDASGTVTIDGKGSSWTHTNKLILGIDNIGATGSGTLTVRNGGAMTDTQGIIGYTPGSTGTVAVDGAGSTWTNSNVISVGHGGTGTLTISNGGAVSSTDGYIGHVGGTGTVTVDGAGSSWTMSGTLLVGNNSTGTLTISNGGTVSAASATIAAVGTSTGTLNIGAASGPAPAAPGTLVTPTVTFGAGTGSIVFNHTASDYTFKPVIAGLGTVTVEAGTTILTAANTYSGTTTINGGTLEVDGSIANSSVVTVNAGGTLSGTGIVDPPAATTIAGTLAPGNAANPTGTLTITGNLAFQSGALYLVHLAPSAAASTNVSGSATLTGGTVQAVFAPGSYVGKSYTILHTTGGLGGTTFSGMSGGLPGFNAALSYTPTDVLLKLTASLGGPLNINQQNAANAVNNFFNGGGALPPGFLTLFGLSGNNLANGLSQVSGEVATGAQQGAFQLGRQFLNLLLDFFADGRSGMSGGVLGFAPERETLLDDIGLAYAKVMKAPTYKAPAVYEPRWSVWASGFGGYNTTKGDAVIGSHDLTARAGGFAAGLDYRLTDDSVIGFGLAGGTTNWTLAGGLGGGKSDAFQAGILGKTRSGPFYLAGAFAFANHWMSTDRTALGDHLTADFIAQSFGGRVESGYRFASPILAITPYAALQAQSARTPFYSERDLTGGGFGLSFSARNATDVRSELGSRFDKAMPLASGALFILRGRLAWAHDWVSDPSATAIFQALPGQNFVVNGARPATNAALASAGAELQLANGVTLSSKFDGEFGSRASTYAGTGTLRVAW